LNPPSAQSNTGMLLRFLPEACSACTTGGTVMAASENTCTLLASFFLPPETASSKVHSDSPHQCGASVVY